jgi:putative heme transporter
VVAACSFSNCGGDGGGLDAGRRSEPSCGFIDGRWPQALVAVVLVFMAGAGIFGVIGVFTLPVLFEQISTFIQDLPGLQIQIAEQLSARPLTAHFATSVRSFDLKKVTENINWVSAITFSGTMVELAGYVASSIVLAIYFVFDPTQERVFLYSITPRRFHVRLARITLNLERIVGGYIRGQLFTSLLIWIFVLVLLTLLKIPNALAFATFAALADILPFVGGVLATAPPALREALRRRGAQRLQAHRAGAHPVDGCRRGATTP